MNEQQNGAQPAYDVYVEQDRVTFVRKPEQAIDSTLAQEPLRWVLAVLLGSHSLIVLLSLTLAAYLTLVPATATVYALADRVPAIASVHSLPAVSMSLSQIVPTSGRVHVPATQARGLVVFYNALTQPQTIAAGTLLVGSDGQEIVTDQAAYVPGGDYASNGQATVRAHALNSGVEGNIKAGDVSGPCCRAFIQAVNAQFSGGRNARDFQAVTQSDISAATTGLLSQLQHLVTERLSSLTPTGEAIVAPVPCTTHTASSKPGGAEATHVMVTVRQTCQPSAYNTSELQRSLAILIADKTPEQARTILAGQGIKDAGIRLEWLRDRLPADAKLIHIVIVFH